MISGHVIVKGTEENIPYATILIKENGQGTVSNEEGQFEFRKLPAGNHVAFLYRIYSIEADANHRKHQRKYMFFH